MFSGQVAFGVQVTTATGGSLRAPNSLLPSQRGNGFVEIFVKPSLTITNMLPWAPLGLPAFDESLASLRVAR